MQWLKNRNILIVVLLVILALAVALVGLLIRPSRTISDAALPDLEAAEDTADAPLYLLVTAGSTTYAPIHLVAEDVLTLTQGDMVNTIHVTPESVWMEASTCDNQDCVEQGEVTADNRESRILGNAIICLPNLVLLELFTAEELQDMGILTADSE